MVVSKITAALLLILFLSGCSEKTSQNPDEVYELWSGTKPSPDVKIIHGKYWRSAHWSKEYTIYIEMKASKEWVEAFVKQNNLQPGTHEHTMSDVPDWFTPSSEFLVFHRQNDPDGSRYYFSLKQDRIFIFEAQL